MANNLDWLLGRLTYLPPIILIRVSWKHPHMYSIFNFLNKYISIANISLSCLISTLNFIIYINYTCHFFLLFRFLNKKRSTEYSLGSDMNDIILFKVIPSTMKYDTNTHQLWNTTQILPKCTLLTSDVHKQIFVVLDLFAFKIQNGLNPKCKLVKLQIHILTSLYIF